MDLLQRPTEPELNANGGHPNGVNNGPNHWAVRRWVSDVTGTLTFAMRIAKAITLTVEQRTMLTKWSRGRSTPARLVLRAKIVLAAADGRENQEIAAELGCTRRTVGRAASHPPSRLPRTHPRRGST